MKHLLFLGLSFWLQYSFGQKAYVAASDVYDVDEIFFYGYDFSHFKLADEKNLGDDDIVKYVPAWIDLFNELKNESELRKDLKKDK